MRGYRNSDIGLTATPTRTDMQSERSLVAAERIYLDRFEGNAPITDPTLTVLVAGEQVPAEATPDGTYVDTSQRFDARGSLELVFDIHSSRVTAIRRTYSAARNLVSRSRNVDFRSG
jgi:hypothetical protein